MNTDSQSLTDLPDVTPKDLARVLDRYHGGLARYIMRGVPPGGFLRAIIKNDLMGAVARADDDVSLNDIRGLVHFLYFCCPAPCYGSPQKFEAWIRKGGRRGPEEAA